MSRPAPIAREAPIPLAYSIPGAANAIGISKSTVWKLIAEKRLTSFRLGGRTLIAEVDLRDFVERTRKAANSAPNRP